GKIDRLIQLTRGVESWAKAWIERRKTRRNRPRRWKRSAPPRRKRSRPEGRLLRSSDHAAAAAAHEEIADVGGDFIEAALTCLARRPRDVRRQQKIRYVRIEERVAVHRRFLRQHVDAGAAQAMGFQRG